jgi:hypothetical protein
VLIGQSIDWPGCGVNQNSTALSAMPDHVLREPTGFDDALECRATSLY